MEAQLDKVLQGLSIEEEDDVPLLISDAPIFSSAVRNQRSVMGRFLNPDNQQSRKGKELESQSQGSTALIRPPEKLLADAIKANHVLPVVSTSTFQPINPSSGLFFSSSSSAFASGSLEASSSNANAFPKALRSYKRSRACLKNSKERKSKTRKILEVLGRGYSDTCRK
ncbi:unnamed protein product [Arabidopsis halleri]